MNQRQLAAKDWANEAGQRRPACLRKDFLIDEYQVDEALAHGADTVLLMASQLKFGRVEAPAVWTCAARALEIR